MNNLTSLATIAGTVAMLLVIGVFKAQGWIDAEYANYSMIALTTGGGGFVIGKATSGSPASVPPNDDG